MNKYKSQVNNKKYGNDYLLKNSHNYSNKKKYSISNFQQLSKFLPKNSVKKNSISTSTICKSITI